MFVCDTTYSYFSIVTQCSNLLLSPIHTAWHLNSMSEMCLFHTKPFLAHSVCGEL